MLPVTMRNSIVTRQSPAPTPMAISYLSIAIAGSLLATKAAGYNFGPSGQRNSLTTLDPAKEIQAFSWSLLDFLWENLAWALKDFAGFGVDLENQPGVGSPPPGGAGLAQIGDPCEFPRVGDGTRQTTRVAEGLLRPSGARLKDGRDLVVLKAEPAAIRVPS